MTLIPEIAAIVIEGGILHGFLNTVASSGSAVSLLTLMWADLDMQSMPMGPIESRYLSLR